MKEFWDDIIDKRNSKLRDSDWTQIPDSPLTAEKKAEWAAYRQALRDIPNNLRNHIFSFIKWHSRALCRH
jgi:hypothetical protein